MENPLSERNFQYVAEATPAPPPLLALGMGNYRYLP